MSAKFAFLLCTFLFSLSNPLTALIFNTELLRVLSVRPGEQITCKMLLANNKDTPEVVSLKQVDYRYTYKGETFFEEPGSLPRSNAHWIDLPEREVTIPPHTTQELLYAIRVPRDTPLGSYGSAILVEPSSFVSEAQAVGEGSIGLNVKVRYAHQVVTTIGQPKAALKILNKTIAERDKKFSFDLDVENSGECFLYPKAILKLFNPSGKLIATAEAPPRGILPGNSIHFQLPLQEAPEGECVGFLLLDDGKDHLFGEKIMVTADRTVRGGNQ